MSAPWEFTRTVTAVPDADTLLATDTFMVRPDGVANLKAVALTDLFDLVGERVYNPREFGATLDGDYHSIASAGYSLAAAQAYFGVFVTADTQSLDWAAFQKCADLAEMAGGGKITWEGTAIFGTPGGLNQYVALGDNTTLAGVGGNSIIKRAAGTVAQLLALIWNKGRATTAGGTGLGNTNIHLRDFVAEGGNAEDGILSWALPAPDGQDYMQSIWLTRVRDFTVINVECRDGRYNGLALEYCRIGTLVGCRFYRNIKNGVYLSGSDRITLVGCHAEDNGEQNGGTTGAGFAIAASWFCTLDGCVGIGNTQAGVVFGRDSQHLTITGGNYDNIGTVSEYLGGALPYAADHQYPAGPYDGVTGYGGYRCAIVGVTITGRVGRYGIQLLNCTDVLIEGVLIAYSGLHGIQFYGSSRCTVHGGTIRNVNSCGIQIVADVLLPVANNNRVIGTVIADSQTVPTTVTGVAVGVSGGGVAVGNEFIAVTVGDEVVTKENVGAGLGVIRRACSWAEAAVQTLTPAPAAVFAPDLRLGEIVNITMPAGNCTLGAPTGVIRVGQKLTISVTQDSGGARLLAASSAYKHTAAANLALDAGANKTTVFNFRNVGGNIWRLVANPVVLA